ncbi:MAG TPA: hypothetical protein VMW80_09020, partial [Candidatus Dormibacteraeota bacterium]|nr:hypothetical protein [Candidatus Dormibacteraeota bacterium]
MLVDLGVTLADGGDCLSDLQVLRDQPGRFGEVASQTTAWRVVEAIDQSLLERIQRAWARARARVWKWGGGSGASDPGLRCHPGEVLLGEGGSRPHLQSMGSASIPCWSTWTRPARHWRAGCGPVTPGPTPPKTMWSCWMRHSPSYGCAP